MEQRVSLVTLGVDDLDASKAFYEALGWQGQEVEETVFFQLPGQALVLWGWAKLAEDAGADVSADVARRPAGGFGGVALAQNVRSAEEVVAVLARVEPAGGRVTQPARRTFYGGYAGYFADPDGHLWEIAHNPGFTLGPDGGLTIPDFSSVSG